jgi:hypothetical protein
MFLTMDRGSERLLIFFMYSTVLVRTYVYVVSIMSLDANSLALISPINDIMLVVCGLE